MNEERRATPAGACPPLPPAARRRRAARALCHAAAGALLCAATLGCNLAPDHAPPPARTSAMTPAPAPLPAAPPALLPSPLPAGAAPAPAHAAATPATPVAPAAPATAAAEPPPDLAAPVAPPTSGPRPEDAPYARFFAALRDLEQGRRADHVRILWLGDSHGAADFWSGALRTVLQKRFGHGGPGFVHLGFLGYRHDGIKHSAEGKWRMRPKGPATTLVTGDGVFGLGGILFGPDSGGNRAQLTSTDAALSSGKLRWDVCYRLNTPNDQVAIALTGGTSLVVKATAEEPQGALRHVTLTSDAGATLSVTPIAGAPDLCGAVIEADAPAKPGVVLDTLGINGARLGTPLAWSEPSWAAELARRAPSLVILEYGTNEAGDFNANPAMYARHLAEVVARVRRVNPDADCLALAPTDRRDTPDRTPIVRDAIRDGARAAGCGFWDTYEVMGGRGSIDAWVQESPPRAAKDGIHLTSRGYRELGIKLGDDLVQRYKP
jgi:lysophospholipase L1-like esterase